MKFLQIAFVAASALATVASAAQRVSIATVDVGGAGHRGGGDMGARDRQRRRVQDAEEKRRLRLEALEVDKSS